MLRDVLEGAFEVHLRVSTGGSQPTSTSRSSLTNQCQPVSSGPVDGQALLGFPGPVESGFWPISASTGPRPVGQFHSEGPTVNRTATNRLAPVAQ